MADSREPDGRFSAGNRFWEARSSAGRNPKFATSEDLWSACVEYFEWNADNPLHEAKIVQAAGMPVMEALPKMRAMTLGGLCLFLGVTERAWRAWRDPEANNHRPDLVPVIMEAEQIIRQQKFEGASAGLLNPTIISRDLGLTDKSEVDHSSKDGSMRPDHSPEDIARQVAFLLAQGIQST